MLLHPILKLLKAEDLLRAVILHLAPPFYLNNNCLRRKRQLAVVLSFSASRVLWKYVVTTDVPYASLERIIYLEEDETPKRNVSILHHLWMCCEEWICRPFNVAAVNLNPRFKFLKMLTAGFYCRMKCRDQSLVIDTWVRHLIVTWIYYIFLLIRIFYFIIVGLLLDF